jgi:glycosyltransferase involved in cell wall biosynthesis
LEKRLESIFAQTLKEFEVILIDDASTDNSLDILKRYERHPSVTRLIASEKNSGSPFGQWEAGLALCSGKYVWIAESDDFADEKFLEVLTPALENDPEVGMAFCASVVVDEEGNARRRNSDDSCVSESFKMTGDEFVREHLYYKCAVPNVSGTLMRKETIASVGFVPNDFRYVGDWMFWIRFFESGAKVYFVNQKLNYFRTHGGTTRSFSSREKFADYMVESFKVLHYSKTSGKADLLRVEARMDFLAKKISNRYPAASILSSQGRSLIRRLSPYDPKVMYRIMRQKLVRR